MKSNPVLHRTALGLCAVLGSFSAAAFPIAPLGTEGFVVVVSSTSDIIATYEGNSASYSNDLYLALDAGGSPGDDGNTANDLFIFNNHTSPVGSTANLGSFTAGTELLFRLHVNDTGYDYFTGPASRNPDNKFHARVQTDFLPSTTLVSFEDLYDTPEFPGGFNDLSFSFVNTVGSPTPTGGLVPESSSVLSGAVLAGLLGLGVRRWRKA